MPRKQSLPATNGHEAIDDASVTPGTDWRATYIKTLPSGFRARLRPVDVTTLLMAGDIPDVLTPLVLSMLFEPEALPRDELSKRFGFTREELPVIDLICRAAFVEPRIVDEPLADDEISIDDVSLLDRAAVYTMTTSGVEVLRRFRLESAPDVATIPDGDQDGDASVSDVPAADIVAVGESSV